VCVEPDPLLCEIIRRARPRDTVINAGVSAGEQTSADFFIMSQRALNTFSREDAERLDKGGTYRIENVMSVPLIPVNEILQSNFQKHPNILSIDTEGSDLSILRGIDFGRFRPEIICVETLTFAENRLEQHKIPAIGALLVATGYFAYADTHLNTIFVDNAAWG